jgi:hypothetical protein
MNTNSSNFDKPGNAASGEFDKSEWIAQARRLLDESADGLDAAALSRLNRARQAALEPRLRRARQPWLLPAGLAGACAMLLVVAIWAPHHAAPVAGEGTRVAASNTTSAETNDALGGDDSLEFYQDLEFYAWLDAQGKDGSG